MRTLVRSSALASLLFSLGALPADDNRIYWHSDYGEALREARQTGKPLFLEFRCEP